MIWFYHRGSESMTIETRFNALTGLYELIWQHPDGQQTVESFSSEDEFRARSEAVEGLLTRDRWHPTGTPVLQPDGWKPQ
ncbi:MAG: hypothetical protein R2712_29865 [Vicinamibacterales bacterium]